ncbi:MAG: hypothetical protein ACREC9_15660, partial [Methylocella sp.]
LNADPAFANARDERMRKLHADPAFAKANAERMRGKLGVRAGAEDAYRLARRKGFGKLESVHIANGSFRGVSA